MSESKKNQPLDPQAAFEQLSDAYDYLDSWSTKQQRQINTMVTLLRELTTLCRAEPKSNCRTIVLGRIARFRADINRDNPPAPFREPPDALRERMNETRDARIQAAKEASR